MNKTKITAFFVVTLLITPFVNNVTVDKAFDMIGVVFSVLIGFSITSLSIIATSKFSKRLYQIESSQNNSKTLLHEIVDKFYSNMTLYILTVVLIVFYLIIPKSDIVLCEKLNLTIVNFLKSAIIVMTFQSLFSSKILLKYFKQFIVQAAKDN